MTAIPYGSSGLMLGLRADHDADEYGECRLCSPLPVRAEFWQRGCPTTGLPVAAVWRSRAAGEPVVDPVDRARRAVTEVQQVAARREAAAMSGRLVCWQADDQVAGWRRREDVAEWDASALTVDGVA